MNITQHRPLTQDPPHRRVFVLSVALVVLTLLALAIAVPDIPTSPHADKQHRHDAITPAQIKRACDEKGAYQIWKDRQRDKFYLLCQVDEDTFGIRIIAKNAKGVWEEITAFAKSDPSLKSTVQYLLRLNATRFIAPLP